jgi:long-chain fatty acid transport protein
MFVRCKACFSGRSVHYWLSFSYYKSRNAFASVQILHGEIIMNFKFIRLTLLSAVCVTTMSAGANAAAFYLQEQSVSGLGTAFAGAAADTPDASTVYYNPAGMTELSGPELQIGATLLLPHADFDDTGSTFSGAGTGAGLIGGDDSGNPFDPEVLPQAFLAVPVYNNKLWLGLGLTAPFGLADDYGEDFTGRYNSTDSELLTIDLQPTAAYRVNDWISLGAGVNIQYVYANLKTAIASPGIGAPNTTTDGVQRLTGDDVSVGYNLGIQMRPTPTTKVGLTYKTAISHELDGDVDIDYPTSPLGGGLGGLSNTFGTAPGKAELDLPNIASVGVSQMLNDRWTVLGSVNWYEWSNFNDIPVTSTIIPGGSNSTAQNYENTWGFAIGARYRLNDKWLLKGGFQYDQTPTVTSDRSTRIPDGDRMWFSTGATYSLTPKIDIDLAAAYVNVKEERVDLTETNSFGVTTNTQGDTDGSVGIVAAAIKYKF